MPTKKATAKKAATKKAAKPTPPPFKIVTPDSGQQVVELADTDLISLVLEATGDREMRYDRNPIKRIKLRRLALHYLPFKEALEESHFDDANAKELFKFVTTEYERIKEESRIRIAAGRVRFEDVEFMLTEVKDPEVVYKTDYGDVGGEVKGVEHHYGFFESLAITVQSITGTQGTSTYNNRTIKLYAFGGEKNIADLPIRLATPEDKVRLHARGLIFTKYVNGKSHLEYTGTLVRPSWWSREEYRAAGRVMVDSKTLRKLEPNFFEDGFDSEAHDDTPQVKDEDIWMCEAKLYGFSFVAKKWGELAISGLSEPIYNKAAWSTLVMEESRKKTMMTLVTHANSGFKDIIANKGGGCIFLLHGPPGVGKTLTAEAMAEMLERPLYSISVGELGTDPKQLEEALQAILEMANVWKAVILLDEADIFLEARNEKDITRNAMVGVFLRLMEYHQGIIFLTTNRVRQFDPAFHSRISVAIQYPEMTAETRTQVWRNLLQAAGITMPEGASALAALSESPLNGRQIKNTIRLAAALAHSETRPVKMEDLLTMIHLSQQFEKDIKK